MDIRDKAKPFSNRHEVNDSAIVKDLTAGYYAEIAAIDENVGKLMAELKKRGLEENTLIVLTADHGNMLADHNRWFKGVMYEGSSRISLIMKASLKSDYANQFNRGKTISNIVQSIDVMPTNFRI